MPLKEHLIEAKTRKALLSGGKAPDTSKVNGSGPDNRHGMPKLPPGQREVHKWPVLDLGIHPDLTAADWSLTVRGACDEAFSLDWDAFMALPQVADESDFHCVTTWSKMDNHWRGVRFSEIAGRAKPHGDAGFVYFTAYDGYSTNLPLAECMDDDVLLVHTWEDKPLPKEHGGPVRMIVPKKYAWKGAKWIKEIVFQTADTPGFWEVRGYSNTAEPWYNDRYA